MLIVFGGVPGTGKTTMPHLVIETARLTPAEAIAVIEREIGRKA